jgi:uncharacterized protein YecT (DUF1311 family)
VADLLTQAPRFRDAPLGEATTAPEDFQYCLPKSLHVANSELNIRYAASQQSRGPNSDTLRNAQRAWISERDKECAVKELSGLTQSGWLAYVLSDSAKAQCVLRHTRSRTAALSASQ